MSTTRQETRHACKEHLDQFFQSHPGTGMRTIAMKVLRFMAASDVPMKRKAGGWATGIIYFLANYRNRRPCGVSGTLNADIEGLFDVSMSTARKRAAQVEKTLEI